MKLVTTKFKSGGLHEQHVVAIKSKFKFFHFNNILLFSATNLCTNLSLSVYRVLENERRATV